MTEFDPEMGVGDFALRALKERQQNIIASLDQVVHADTMISGLPNIVSAMNELSQINDTHSKALAEIIEAAETDGSTYTVVKQAEASLAHAIRASMMQQQVLAKSLRGVAKTQIGLAKSIKHLNSLMLIYLSSDEFMMSAMLLADQDGGKEGHDEYVRQKSSDAGSAAK